MQGIGKMNNTKASVLQSVKHAIRNGYAWPGGYPLYVIMSDGVALSCAAARENWQAIVRSTIQGARDGWCAEGAAINWEDAGLVCDHTGAPIESAYGD